MIKHGFVLVAALAVGCDLDDDDDDDNVIVITDTDGDGIPDDQEEIPPGTVPFEWGATLTGVGPYPVEGGSTVVLLDDGQAFTSTIAIRNDEPGAVRPWHVHFGTCGSGGGIVGPPEAYPALRVGGDGAAATQTNVFFELDPLAQYHVNVHLSETQLDILVACGNLIRQ